MISCKYPRYLLFLRKSYFFGNFFAFCVRLNRLPFFLFIFYLLFFENMKISLLLSVLVISFVGIVHCDTIDVAYRCTYCNTGNCAETTMEIGVCTQFINPCTNVAEGYYKIEEQNGSYYIYTYLTSDCPGGVGIELVCDYCSIDASICSAFYLKCGSIWWWLIPMLAICFCCCLAAAVIGGLAFYKKKQQQTAHSYSHVEPVSYQQASYQSTGYQS